MPLRLAFDLDGVLADLTRVLEHRARALVRAGRLHRARTFAVPRRAVTSSTDDTCDGSGYWETLDGRQRHQVWASLARRRRLWDGLREIEPGAVARLARLTAEHGWDVVFLTSRPASNGSTSVQVQSQRWLASHGFTLPTVIICKGSRGPLAMTLRRDIVIDDRSRGCLEIVTESTARAVLIWRPERGAPPAWASSYGIHVAASMSDCLDHLAAAAAGAQLTNRCQLH